MKHMKFLSLKFKVTEKSTEKRIDALRDLQNLFVTHKYMVIMCSRGFSEL